MQTFNEFFVRELKPGVRSIACMERDDVAVCAADSRLMAFKSADDSLRFWIKVFILFFLGNTLRYLYLILSFVVIHIF